MTPDPRLLARGRPATPLIRRTRWIILLVLILGAYGVYRFLGEGGQGKDPAAATCAALPPELRAELASADDCMLLHRNLTQALATQESGALTRWSNLKTGSTGSIKIGATEMRAGVACRQADVGVTRTGGTERRVQLTVCLKEGRWTMERR